MIREPQAELKRWQLAGVNPKASTVGIWRLAQAWAPPSVALGEGSFGLAHRALPGLQPATAVGCGGFNAMLRKIFLALTSFAAVMWTIWAQAAEPITVLAPF